MRHKLRNISFYNKRFFSALTDKLLVNKVKKGDKEAYGKLYRRYFDSIYRYIFFRVGQDRETAEDLVQIVFFKALVKIDEFNEEGVGFRPWIYRIAHNQIIDHYRSYKSNSSLTENLPDENQNFEDRVLKDLEYQKVLSAFEKIPEEQREIITMRFISELSNKEIADALNKNEEAVRSMIYRGVKNLRKILNKDE
jgi:RNA polymerase sigma-70 factor, ECF subfamily